MTGKFKLNNRHSRAFVMLLLTIFILSAYWPVQKYEFINYDDTVYVTSNYSIQNGITFESVKNTFIHFNTGHWHPLTMISHMLDWQLFGNRAGGHHWTNVIIHIINAILLFVLFNKLTGSVWRSTFVAALFAVHPLNVESVAWVSERKNVLSTFFLLVTMLFYVRYVNKPDWKRYLPVFLCFVLGLMSKPMLVTLPFVLLLLDYWPLNRLKMSLPGDEQPKIKELIRINGNKMINLVLEKVPLLILSIISIFSTFHAARYIGTVSGFDTLPLLKRFPNAVVSYALYIRKFFLPTDLAVFYPISDISVWQFSSALLFLVIVTIFVFRYFLKYPYLFVGWLWYIGTLVPVIGLMQVGSQAMADRYAYVSLIGILIIIAWGTGDIADKQYFRNIVVGASMAFLFYLFVFTKVQISYWQDTSSVFGHALDVTRNNYIAHFGMGNELLKNKKIDEAINHYHASIILDPRNDSALVGYARALQARGENKKAMAALLQALRFKPESIDAHHHLGFILFKEGRIDEAIIEYQKAVFLDGKDPALHNNLGNAFVKKGKVDEAIKEFREVLKINPKNAGSHNNLAMLLMRQGRNKEAVLHFREAIRLSPAFANAHFQLAKILKKEGLVKEAEYHYQESININPEYKNFKEDKEDN